MDVASRHVPKRWAEMLDLITSTRRAYGSGSGDVIAVKCRSLRVVAKDSASRADRGWVPCTVLVLANRLTFS